MPTSIMQDEKKCFICGTKANLQYHHIYEGSRRQISDRLGLTVWLCFQHHQMIHLMEYYNKELKKKGQQKYLETHTMDEWMKEIGKNYL